MNVAEAVAAAKKKVGCVECGYAKGARNHQVGKGYFKHPYVPPPWLTVLVQAAERSEDVTRVIDGKFVVKGGQIVKQSSGEVIPESEPLVLVRARDYLALPMLEHYRKLCVLDGCNDFQLGLVDELLAKFRDYASDPRRMKQPGITRGAAWNPDAPEAGS